LENETELKLRCDRSPSRRDVAVKHHHAGKASRFPLRRRRDAAGSLPALRKGMTNGKSPPSLSRTVAAGHTKNFLKFYCTAKLLW
jgi:hypothetical protein